MGTWLGCGNMAGSPPGGREGFVKHACLCKTEKDGLCAHLGGVWWGAGVVQQGCRREARGPGIRGPWQQCPGC